MSGEQKHSALIDENYRPHYSNNLLEITQDLSPVAQSQNVAHHGHHSQGAGVVGPPVEPNLEEE